MAKALTAKGIENIKPTAQRREVPDGLIPGLYLLFNQAANRAGLIAIGSMGALASLPSALIQASILRPHEIGRARRFV